MDTRRLLASLLFLPACAHHPDVPIVAMPVAPDVVTPDTLASPASPAAPSPERPAKFTDLALLTSIRGEYYLAGTTAVEAAGPWTFDASHGEVLWVSPTEATDLSRPAGERWRAGAAECTAVGYAAVVAEAVDQTPGEESYLAPNCGSPTVWTKLRCTGEPSVFAVPLGVSQPRIGEERPMDPAMEARANAVARATATWQANVQAARTDAEKRRLQVTESVVVSAWLLGSTPLLMADASVWSGEGTDWCGGEDVVGRFVVVMTDEADPKILTNQFVDSRTEVTGFLDISGDGVPTLLVGNDVLFNGALRALEPVTMCICGC